MSSAQPEIEPPGASILLVTGGTSVMQKVYRERGVGYWSAAFGAILARHGWLDFDTADASVLSNSSRLRRHDMVIVAWLPEWDAAWLQGLHGYDGVVFLEGPLPPMLESFAGLERVPGEPTALRGRLHVRDRLRAQLAQRGIDLEGEDLAVRPAQAGDRALTEPARDQLLAELARLLAATYWTSLRDGRPVFGEDPHNNGLALLALARYLTRLPAGGERDRFLGQLMAAVSVSRPPPRSRRRRSAWQRAAGAQAASYAALAVAEGALAKAPLEPRAARWGAHMPRRRPRGGPQARRLAALRAYVAVLAGQEATGRRLAAAASTRTSPLGLDALRLWLLSAAEQALGSEAGILDPAGSDWLDRVAAELQGRGSECLPSALEGWQVGELLVLAAVLQRRGALGAADALLAQVLDESADPEGLRLWNGSVARGSVRPRRADAVGPPVLLGLLDLIPATTGLPAPDSMVPRPVHDQHRLVLRTSPLSLESFRNVAGEDELALVSAGPDLVGVMRRGRVLSSSFPLLAHLVHAHVLGAADRDIQALQTATLALLEDQLARYDRGSLEIRPAPAPPAITLRRDGIVESGAGDLEVRKVSDGRDHCEFMLRSAASDRSVELHYGTSRTRVSLTPGPARPVRFERSREARYEELAAAVAATGQRGQMEFDPEELLPRLGNLTEVVSRFTPFSELAGTKIGDIGCGYGPFPLGLYLVERPGQVLGIDVNSDSLSLATQLAAGIGAGGTSFVRGDVLDLPDVVTGLDVLVALNVLYYLTSRRLHLRAAETALQSLRPGGALVALLTNRLHVTDAFTGLPGIHRLPRSIVHHYVRLRRVRHGYRDVRSPTPAELIRTYRRAGFQHVAAVDPDQVAVITRPRRYRKARFYLVALKSPDGTTRQPEPGSEGRPRDARARLR